MSVLPDPSFFHRTIKINIQPCLQNTWDILSLPIYLQELNRSFFEAFSIIILQHFGLSLQNKTIILLTDNIALTSVHNKQSSKDSLNMVLDRDIYLCPHLQCGPREGTNFYITYCLFPSLQLLISLFSFLNPTSICPVTHGPIFVYKNGTPLSLVHPAKTLTLFYPNLSYILNPMLHAPWHEHQAMGYQ